MGTPLYSAPEILEKKVPYDDRVDVWSIGAIFFRMLTGEEPFPGKDKSEVIKLIKK